ncbi:MAG: terminase, partial [Mesorhizobium sp.]
MSRHVTFMTIEDAGHYSPEQRAEIIAAFRT